MKCLITVLLLVPMLGAAQWSAYSKMKSNGKDIIVTNWIRGYVDLIGGERKEGQV